MDPLQRALRDILVGHGARYPHWGVEDVYKLVHQAALGSEHAVSDEAAAHKRFMEEIRGLGPGPEEPLIDPISPDGAVVRVHLRPLARRGEDAQEVFHAFLRTVREFRGSVERLEMYGDHAVQAAAEGIFSFSAQTLEDFVVQMKAAGFPAVHHSAVFETEYRPAYRVVASELVPGELVTRT